MSEADFVFLFTDGAKIVAETRTGLVEQVIDGYNKPNSSVEDLYEARVDSLTVLSSTVQVAIVADSVASLPVDALNVLLGRKDDHVPVFDRWPYETPLILFATGYAPYTDIPAPSGDSLVWVNPHNEETFLSSLTALGLGELFVKSTE